MRLTWDRLTHSVPRGAPGGASVTSRYLAGIAIFCIAVLLRYLWHDSLAAKIPFLQFYPAIMLAAWFGGLGPGLLVTKLSAVAAGYFLLHPVGFSIADPADRLALGAFVGFGAVISWLIHRLQVTHEAQRLAAATALARADRLDAILNMTVDGIIVINARGRIEAFNRGAHQLLGYSEDEVLGRNVSMLMPSPHHEAHDSYLERYLRTGEAKIIGSGREVQGRRKDGTTFPLHLSVSEVVIEGERKFTGILHDLTDRVQMEEALRERAALAQLGEMAAIIAHEVKNPLAGIRGAIQVFGNRMKPPGVDARILPEIVARIDALDRMMRDLLLFARPPEPNREPVDLVPLVEVTASLLTRDPVLCNVTVEIEGAVPPVAADPAMLQVVFQNLLINSAHAMEGTGQIKVAVKLVGTVCEIAVVDAGPGIPVEVRQKVFMPFFTTKARGSGLGLPTVKRFVEAHHGEITIECPPTGGTTVLIRLPIHVGGHSVAHEPSQ